MDRPTDRIHPPHQGDDDDHDGEVVMVLDEENVDRITGIVSESANPL